MPGTYPRTVEGNAPFEMLPPLKRAKVDSPLFTVDVKFLFEVPVLMFERKLNVIQTTSDP